MNKAIYGLLAASILSVPAAAQQPAGTVDADCKASATQATGYNPDAPPPTSTQPVVGGRARGAARGAAAGAVVGGVQNEQHDRAPEAVKDEHRQNQAKSGAAAGMVVGGSRQRQARRENRKQQAAVTDAASAWQSNYNSCVSKKGGAAPS